MNDVEKEFWDTMHDEAIVYMNENQFIEFKSKLMPLFKEAIEKTNDTGYKLACGAAVKLLSV